MKKYYITIAALMIVLIAAYVGHSFRTAPQKELRIFHAGSLTGLIDDIADVMEGQYSVKVLNEPGGSIDVIRKVVDLGKKTDLVMVADHRLIEQLMMPKHASWLLVFASNEMVLAYTDSSRYSDEINEYNWLDIITRPDVKVGISDPNKDPCGYRSLMVLALTYLQKGDIRAMKMLEGVSAVEIDKSSILIDVSHGIPKGTGNFVFRDKSVDLIALLESGVLDYAFEYKNVAIQHGLKYVELPKEINLSIPELDDLYGKVLVKVLGSGGDAITLQARSITYGLTIPDVAENVEEARKFIELLISEREMLEKNGFYPLESPIIVGEAPQWLVES